MAGHSLTALLDGDILLHLAISRNQVDFDGELITDLEAAKESFSSFLNFWVKSAGADDFKLCLSDSKNFRKALVPSYKASRGPKPSGFAQLKDWAHKEFDGAALQYPNIEADDLIGILLTEAPDSRIAVSFDKDMKTLPGLHHNPKIGVTQRIEEKEANLNWLRQVLTGDAIDGYTGVPKIGPVKASKILHSPAPLSVLWRVVLDTYEAAKLDPKYAVATARLAYILRNGDYDLSKGEILWRGPEPCKREDLPPEYRSNVSSGRHSAPTRHSRKDDRARSRRSSD